MTILPDDLEKCKEFVRKACKENGGRMYLALSDLEGQLDPRLSSSQILEVRRQVSDALNDEKIASVRKGTGCLVSAGRIARKREVVDFKMLQANDHD